jgi:hypothetical protein
VAAVSVGAWHAEKMRTDLPDVSASFEAFEKLVEVRSHTSLVAEMLKDILTRFANASFIVILLCVITNTVDVLRAAAVTYLPFVLLFLAGSPVSIMAKSRGEIGLFNLWTASPQEPRFESYALHYIPLLVGAVLLFIRIGRRVDEKTMWRKVTIVFAAQTGLAAAAVEFMWNNVGEWSDEKKTIVVTVVVPLVVEVALTICRFTTRSLKLQHEASSWAFNGCTFLSRYFGLGATLRLTDVSCRCDAIWQLFFV